MFAATTVENVLNQTGINVLSYETYDLNNILVLDFDAPAVNKS